MAARPHRPTLLNTPQAAVPVPAGTAELWLVLDTCARLDEGTLLAPADLWWLVDAAAAHFAL